MEYESKDENALRCKFLQLFNEGPSEILCSLTAIKPESGMEKLPGPPPIPASLAALDDWSSGSEEEHRRKNEQTPLIRHTSRKSGSRKNAFRKPDGFTELSTISDCKTHSQSSWSDGEKRIGDDDDRSISTYSTTGESVASLKSLATVSLENFREGLSIPFTDEEGSYQKIARGLGSLSVLVSLNATQFHHRTTRDRLSPF